MKKSYSQLILNTKTFVRSSQSFLIKTMGLLRKSLPDLVFHSVPYYINRKLFARPILPRYLLLGLTYRCNCKCLMCTIWKRKDYNNEISLSDIKKLFLGDKHFWKKLSSVGITGGEPFIRKELVEIINVINNSCPKLVNVGFNTNGLLVDSIINKTRLMRERLNPNIFLDICISLDGIGETHNKIRGIPNAFSLVNRTINELLKIRGKYPNLSVAANCVLQSSNVNQIDSIKEFCKSKGVSITFTLPIIGDDYFDNKELSEEIKLSNNDLMKIKQYYAESQFRFDYHHFIQYIEGNRRTQACVAGFADLYIDPHGNVYPCNYLYNSFGNIKDAPISKIWYSEDASRVRKNLPVYPFCRECIQNCDIGCIEKVDVISYYYSLMRHYKKYYFS